jgi:molecular chaperone GrpE
VLTSAFVSSDESNKFKTDIGDDVIAAALASVKKREAEAQTQAGGDPALAAEVESLKAQLDLSQTQGRELMAKLKDEHEKLLRAAADLDNYRKRAAKEKEETQKFGNEKLLKDFLPVIDNLDRALEAAAAATDYESLLKGVTMTRRLFEDALGKHGVKPFTAKGQPFDPAQHEAMSQVETDELPANHVHSEMVRGFTLNDRLMRPALVVVTKAKETAS